MCRSCRTSSRRGAQFEKATETRFLHPENDFSGLVFFSELDGTLGETWEFREGKRTRQMHAHLKSELSTEEYRAMTESVDLTAGISLPRTALTRNSEEDCGYCNPGYTCITHTTHEVGEVVVTASPPPPLSDHGGGGSMGGFIGGGSMGSDYFPPNAPPPSYNYTDGGGGYSSGSSGSSSSSTEDPTSTTQNKPRVSLTMLGGGVQLMTSYTITVNVYPTETQVNKVKLYFQQDINNTNVPPIYDGTNMTYTRVAKKPGKWQIRAVVETPRGTLKSEIHNFEEMFPDHGKILQAVQPQFDALWQKTKDYATQNQATHTIQEYGAWVWLDTTTGQYSVETADGVRMNPTQLEPGVS